MPPNSEIEKLERRWRDNPKGTVFAPYAEVLRKNGDHALARDVLKQGLERHPDHIPGNIVLGRCCLDLGEDGPAEAAFAHVLDLDPENVIALKALAEITERQGRLAEANNWLTRLISVDPSNDEARDQAVRVAAARESAAAALGSDFMTGGEAPAASAPTVEVQLAPRAGATEPPETQDRAEADAGEIDDVSDVAAFADEALDKFLDQPGEALPPKERVLPAAEPQGAPVSPGVAPEPGPISDLEPAELDLSAAASEVQPLADLTSQEEFVPPSPEPPGRPSGPAVFSFGVEENVAEIELRPAGTSEFLAPDDSAALLELSAGKSEFQVPDASAELRPSTRGNSEFQTPDASEDLKFSGRGRPEYQPTSGAEEPPESARNATGSGTGPAPSGGDPGWGGPVLPSTLAAMAAMPTEELSTEPPAAPPADQHAPSWLFEDEAPEVPGPTNLPLVGPESEPEPVAAHTSPEPVPEPVAAFTSPEPEPAPVSDVTASAAEEPGAESGARTSADLKLIFPDDAAQPEPHRVRRITQAEVAPAPAAEAPEPAIGEPEPIMTETMAELYARQGHTAEALRVYRALAERQPADARLRDRIRELESRTAGAARRLTYVAVETGGESVESFFRSLAEARPGSGGAVSGFDHVPAAPEENSGAPTRPARDPLSLSAIFGEEPVQAPPAPTSPESPTATKPGGGPDAFSFDQFFGGSGASSQSSSSARPSGASEEDLDQFQNWLKSLKR
jgi:tetratricopeptide (TPR) repeat protein